MNITWKVPSDEVFYHLLLGWKGSCARTTQCAAWLWPCRLLVLFSNQLSTTCLFETCWEYIREEGRTVHSLSYASVQSYSLYPQHSSDAVILFCMSFRTSWCQKPCVLIFCMPWWLVVTFTLWNKTSLFNFFMCSFSSHGGNTLMSQSGELF